jgi:hypothetical protein
VASGSTGKARWSKAMGDEVQSKATLSPDGKTVYVGSWDNKVQYECHNEFKVPRIAKGVVIS